jgi:hypothetical protein
MIPIEITKDFFEVPEEVIIKGAEMFGGDQNNFAQLLYNGTVYKKMGLEPMYMINNSQTMMVVTCKETWGQKLH